MTKYIGEKQTKKPRMKRESRIANNSTLKHNRIPIMDKSPHNFVIIQFLITEDTFLTRSGHTSYCAGASD